MDMIDKKLLKELLEYEPDPDRCTQLSPVPCQIYWAIRNKVDGLLKNYEVCLYELMIEAHILALVVSSGMTAEEMYEEVWAKIKRKVRVVLETEFKEGEND